MKKTRKIKLKCYGKTNCLEEYPGTTQCKYCRRIQTALHRMILSLQNKLK